MSSLSRSFNGTDLHQTQLSADTKVAAICHACKGLLQGHPLSKSLCGSWLGKALHRQPHGRTSLPEPIDASLVKITSRFGRNRRHFGSVGTLVDESALQKHGIRSMTLPWSRHIQGISVHRTRRSPKCFLLMLDPLLFLLSSRKVLCQERTIPTLYLAKSLLARQMLTPITR